MSAGGGRARLRSVLHHQADRAGHRPRAVDDLRLRAAVERPRARSTASRGRARRSAFICRVIMATRPSEQAASAAAEDHARDRRDRAGGRGRARGARRHRRDAREQGYRTLRSGRRTVRACASCGSRQRIDLLVTDVGLPGMNGRQLADQAREMQARPESPVHHRLCRERRDRQRLPAARHGDDHQAVRSRQSVAAHPRDGVGLARVIPSRAPDAAQRVAVSCRAGAVTGHNSLVMRGLDPPAWPKPLRRGEGPRIHVLLSLRQRRGCQDEPGHDGSVFGTVPALRSGMKNAAPRPGHDQPS